VETSRPGRRQPGSLGGEPPGPTDRPKRSGAEEESFGRDRGALNLNEEEQMERGRENTEISLFLFFGLSLRLGRGRLRVVPAVQWEYE
jgi:hypothetical protein